MWIFGYGSLIWKADFPFETKAVGHVKGFERKFYQHSTYHRGTPEKPGRVVTLVPSSPESQVWGVAYKIRNEDVEKVVNQLDYREKGGYKRMQVVFYPKMIQAKPFQITIYVGATDNLNYAGEADEDSIATQIVNSSGPSGTNAEYVYNLAKAMRTIAPQVPDEHLFSIEEKVRNLMNISDSQDIKSILN
ncbi:hypothetical protein ILUMI_11672 [Ignelater luminosus]|uniref:glutathione-specific gamma-glutamylcyclotransferase n=1 Tax=Ignelater luminosus TaxID=2038154 RepID=A0A8K0CZP1_IGNLU|nr:hypothetical protein ILUMI_11672 [Ignelater luminosus]